MNQRMFLVLVCLGFVSLYAGLETQNRPEQMSFTSLHSAVVSEDLEQVQLMVQLYRSYAIFSKDHKGQIQEDFASSLMKVTSCGRTAEDLAKDLKLNEIYKYLKSIREEAGIAASDYSAAETPVCCW